VAITVNPFTNNYYIAGHQYIAMTDIIIRCPKCKWEPDGKAHWACTCGTVWDTFSTAGRCPGCGKIWKDTQCIKTAGGCPEWSPHLDWYHGLDEIINKLKKEVEEGWLQEVNR
jgi:hypothetical protein